MIMTMIIYNVLQKRLISQKYKKCSPGKYAMLIYVAVSIHWISIRFDFIVRPGLKIYLKSQLLEPNLYGILTTIIVRKLCICKFEK